MNAQTIPRDTGGPAFPSSNSPETGYYAEGMDLRDYFAAKAMQGLLSNAFIFERYGFTSDMADESQHAYKVADAMLKARTA